MKFHYYDISLHGVLNEKQFFVILIVQTSYSLGNYTKKKIDLIIYYHDVANMTNKYFNFNWIIIYNALIDQLKYYYFSFQ